MTKPRRTCTGTYFEVVAGDLRPATRSRFFDADSALTFAGKHRALARRVDVYSDGTEHVLPLTISRPDAWGEGGGEVKVLFPGAIRAIVTTRK